MANASKPTRHKETPFEKLTARFNATLEEPDFIKRAEGLLLLKEESVTTTNREIERLEKLRKRIEAKTEGIGLGIAAAFIGVGVITAMLPIAATGVVTFALASILGVVIGGVTGLVNWSNADVKISPHVKKMEKQSAKLSGKINSAILDIEREVIQQPDNVKNQYRTAFQHAALRQTQISQVLTKEQAEKAAANQNSSSSTATTAATIATTAAVISIANSR